jgi:hypothetical protein
MSGSRTSEVLKNRLSTPIFILQDVQPKKFPSENMLKMFP